MLISVIALLEERKGHIYLLKALKRILNQKPYLMPKVLIEGKGSQEQILSNFIEENGMRDHVMMIGEIKNIFNLINASDIIILPSIKDEDFPNIILESMSLGVPVIGTNIAGIPQQIKHQHSGIIVQPKDVSQLEKGIIELVQDKGKRKMFSMNAKRIFKDNYLTDISIKKYLNIYEDQVII